MSKVIVFYHSHYGLTISVDGFHIFNSRQEFEDCMTNYLEKYPINNVIAESNFLRDFAFKFISDDEYDMINKIFGAKFGVFPISDV